MMCLAQLRQYLNPKRGISHVPQLEIIVKEEKLQIFKHSKPFFTGEQEDKYITFYS